MELSAEFKKNKFKILEVHASVPTKDTLARKHLISDMKKMVKVMLLILLRLEDSAIQFASRRGAIVRK